MYEKKIKFSNQLAPWQQTNHFVFFYFDITPQQVFEYLRQYLFIDKKNSDVLCVLNYHWPKYLVCFFSIPFPFRSYLTFLHQATLV